VKDEILTALGVVGEADRPSARASLKTPFESRGAGDGEHLTEQEKKILAAFPSISEADYMRQKKAAARTK
jgi:hypothetical protein